MGSLLPCPHDSCRPETTSSHCLCTNAPTAPSAAPAAPTIPIRPTTTAAADAVSPPAAATRCFCARPPPLPAPLPASAAGQGAHATHAPATTAAAASTDLNVGLAAVRRHCCEGAAGNSVLSVLRPLHLPAPTGTAATDTAGSRGDGGNAGRRGRRNEPPRLHTTGSPPWHAAHPGPSPGLCRCCAFDCRSVGLRRMTGVVD
mmetsp:Transcript_54412/g.106470  ORF Transcript_54412/g.106470 Transcript_54412/m.106470 type:complete len:202 (+) Transcript_54412:331-936(+)